MWKTGYGRGQASCCPAIVGLVLLIASIANGDISGGDVTVKVTGTDSALRCHQEIIGKFAEQDGGPVEYSGGGTGRGIQLLCEVKTDVAVVGTDLDERLVKLLSDAFPDANRQPREWIFSQTALIFVVHRNNAKTNLTVDQLQAMFSGETTNWNQVGGAASKINLYGPEAVAARGRRKKRAMRLILRVLISNIVMVSACQAGSAAQADAEGTLRFVGMPTCRNAIRRAAVWRSARPKGPMTRATCEMG